MRLIHPTHPRITPPDAGAIAVDIRSVRLAEHHLHPVKRAPVAQRRLRPARCYMAEDDELSACVQRQHPTLVKALGIEVSAP